MPTARAHRLDLGGVALHREKLNFLARHFGCVIQQALSDLRVYSRIFKRGIGKEQRGWVDQV